MQRTALALFGFAFLLAACGNAGIANPSLYPEDSIPEASSSSYDKHKKATKAEDELAFLDETPDTDETPETTDPMDKRQVGDVAVRRFSGAFTKAPFMMIEEVTARAGNL